MTTAVEYEEAPEPTVTGRGGARRTEVRDFVNHCRSRPWVWFWYPKGHKHASAISSWKVTYPGIEWVSKRQEDGLVHFQARCVDRRPEAPADPVLAQLGNDLADDGPWGHLPPFLRPGYQKPAEDDTIEYDPADTILGELELVDEGDS